MKRREKDDFEESSLYFPSCTMKSGKSVMGTVEIDEKHRVTLPTDALERLGAQSGDTLDMSFENGSLVLKPKGHSVEADDCKREARIDALLAEFRSLPVLDDRDPDDMLYDENGLPK